MDIVRREGRVVATPYLPWEAWVGCPVWPL